MYWADKGTDKIQRANLDGSGVEDIITGLTYPAGIALDIPGGKIYWTDFYNDKIQRANLDGSNVEDLITTGLSGPYAITLGPIPEPATILLLGVGGLLLIRKIR
jgi:DNA-binding beta-propeller fold protein YncE